MFTQAGINTHPVAVVCFARVSRNRRGGGMRWCWLMRWASGDMAWCSSTMASWGEQVHFHNVFELDHGVWGPSWPTDPAAGARHWIEKGVAPDANSWKAELQVEALQEQHA
jgi:hypothetical protein